MLEGLGKTRAHGYGGDPSTLFYLFSKLPGMPVLIFGDSLLEPLEVVKSCDRHSAAGWLDQGSRIVKQKHVVSKFDICTCSQAT